MAGKALLMAVALMLIGTTISCSKDDGLVPISGEVTYDGKAIQSGSISFIPIDGKGITAGDDIQDGKYSTRVSPGEMAVQINGIEIVTKPNATPEEVERGLDKEQKNYIPAKYNRQSTLRQTITEDEDEYNFHLTP